MAALVPSPSQQTPPSGRRGSFRGPELNTRLASFMPICSGYSIGLVLMASIALFTSLRANLEPIPYHPYREPNNPDSVPSLKGKSRRQSSAGKPPRSRPHSSASSVSTTGSVFSSSSASRSTDTDTEPDDDIHGHGHSHGEHRPSTTTTTTTITPCPVERLVDPRVRADALELVAESSREQCIEAAEEYPNVLGHMAAALLVTSIQHLFFPALVARLVPFPGPLGLFGRVSIVVSIARLYGTILPRLAAILSTNRSFFDLLDQPEQARLAEEMLQPATVMVGVRRDGEVVAMISLRLEPAAGGSSSSSSGKRKSRGGGGGGGGGNNGNNGGGGGSSGGGMGGGGGGGGGTGRGLVLAWVTRKDSRGRAIGKSLLYEAVKVTRQRFGKDATVWFAQDHAHSHTFLGLIYTKWNARKREHKAVATLRTVLAQWESSKKKR